MGRMVDTETEFCLLGPLLVRRGADVLPVPRGGQRVVMAALLLSTRQVVSLDELAAAVWGDAPPPTARVALQNYVMRLRRGLGDTGARIHTQRPGYLIRADDAEVDVTRFLAHLDAARAAVRERAWDTAATHARVALGLWRGDALADVESEVLTLREAPRLAELRLQAVEIRIHADLMLGRNAAVVPELAQLTAAHPLRERLHGLLMSALHQDGRRGEALAVYQQARAVLVEELGTEPGTELQAMHQRVLTDAPVLGAFDPVPATVPVRPPVIVRQLPCTVRHFTGRKRELAVLTGSVGRAGAQQPDAAGILVISGTAGVGKTALAVYWAHSVEQRFPDGHLYVDLRGYDPSQPLPAADALAAFLRALGMPGQDIPPGEAERAARYRSLLAGRQMLVLIDNARSAEHVRPLLPGSRACVTVVTSRDSLGGLVARDGAVRLELDSMSVPEAIGLLRALIGTRVDAEPGAAIRLAGYCCRLPLALRIAAELAIAHPGAPLDDLATELADQQRRLDLLDAGADSHAAVRAVLSWSYQHLDPSTASAFQLLGLHPGPDLDAYAAAALIGTTYHQASQVLNRLTRACLTRAVRPGRYAMHDLLRAYARELAGGGHHDDHQRRPELTRLFKHYLGMATTAANALYPAERYLRPRAPAAARSTTPVTSASDGLAWLNAELPNLVAVATHATACDWPGHATHLSATLSRYMEESGHYPEAILIHGHALREARGSGSKADEVRALNGLGAVEHAQGRHEKAMEYLGQALTLLRETGNPLGEAMTLNNLGLVHLATARYPQAVIHLQQSLALLRGTDNAQGQAIVLGNLGFAEHRRGHYGEAADCFNQALALCHATGDQSCQADTLMRFGALNLQRDRYEEAADQIREALLIFRAIGGKSGEAKTLVPLSEMSLRQANYAQAADQLRQALGLFRSMGDKPGHVRVLNSLGDATFLGGQPASARQLYSTAVEMASQMDMKYEQARAHQGLARGCRAAGDPWRARGHLQKALAIYTDIGAPEAAQVSAELAADTDTCA